MHSPGQVNSLVRATPCSRQASVCEHPDRVRRPVHSGRPGRLSLSGYAVNQERLYKIYIGVSLGNTDINFIPRG
jgi:hypothetical protein